MFTIPNDEPFGNKIRSMKDGAYTELICKPFCEFYSQGKESLLCGTYKYVRDRIKVTDLDSLLSGYGAEPDFTYDLFIRDEICTQCDFFIDGCDYVANIASPPCGGYKVVEILKKKGYL